MDTKTKIRTKLEQLEEDVQKSWLKDLDKTKELSELIEILTEMLQSENLESYFHNVADDVDYFLKKFTKEVTLNILRQNSVVGEGGDDIALEVLICFIKLFLKFHEHSQYSPLLEHIRDIFDSSKSFYRIFHYGVRIHNAKKLISADKYNESLPRKEGKCVEYKPGEQLDVLIDNKKSHNLNDKRVWVRGTVEQVDEESYVINIAEENVYVKVRKSSFDIAAVGSMTKDHDFRTTLKQWDLVDCYDRGRWYPSTVLNVKEEIINGLPKVTYKIGFRVYPEKFSDWKAYARFWSDRGFSTDQFGRKFIGDAEGMDEWITYYSKRIQKFNTYICGDSVIYNTKSLSDDYEGGFFIDDFIPFEYEGRKNFIIGRGSDFSYYFALLLTQFAGIQGFEQMTDILLKEKPYAELVHTIFQIFLSSYSYLHKDYINSVTDQITKTAFTYIEGLNSNELRNIKKDTLELIVRVLKLYLSASKSSEERAKIVEQFSISSSIRMLKTTFLDKRIQAIKTIIDIIKANKFSNDKSKTEEILELIESNGVFLEIYGPNTHIQLINKSKELLEIMLQEDRLSDGELELIWAATKKGDLEGKLTILKTLKEISGSMNRKHIQILLDFAYTKGDDLINEEIELIYELSTLNSEDNGLKENVQKCLDYFTKCLLSSKSDEGSKITALIEKIHDITTLYPQFKKNVLNMCVECLQKSHNCILAMKILHKFLSSDLPDNDLQYLFADDFLVKLFCENFSKYKKTFSHNKKLSAEIDNFSHTFQIKMRLDFSLLLFNFSQFDFVDFIYETLVIDPLVENDKYEFYSYIKKVLEKNSDEKNEERIYKIFEEKICKDTKSCQTLSIQAFESFLLIFLNINNRAGHLSYLQSAANSDKVNVKVSVDPEKLTGFDILWKIVFDSFSNEIMNKGIETLHKLYSNVDKSEAIGEDIAVNEKSAQPSEILLHKCLDMIKSVALIKDESHHQSIEEKRNVIVKCLYFLKLIIEESEKKGTARVKSHSGLLKRKVITLKVDSRISKVNDFSIRVYGNTTLWDLKELISKKAAVGIDFINLMIKGKEKENISENNNNNENEYFSNDFRDIQPTEHGMTVLQIGLSDGDEIRLHMNTANNYIPQAEMARNGRIVPELLSIFHNWFDTFSTEDKQSREELANFIRAVTGNREPIDVNDQRVTTLFAANDRDNKGWIDRESFVSFYAECALRPERRRAVWENLHTMGYRNDLKRYDEPLELFNSDKTLLPRFQLAHNEEFFNILFYLQDLDESIAKEAFKFLCTITTNPKLYKEILTWGEDKENPTSAKFFNSENIYKLIYTLQIVESFIEDVDIDTHNVDSFSNEEAILDLPDQSNITPQDAKLKKVQWMHHFVSQGGFEEMVKILVTQLQNYSNNSTNVLMNNICNELLIKIVRIFFNSSLTKFDVYKANITSTTNSLSDLFEGQLGENVLSKIDYFVLSQNLFNILVKFCFKNNSCNTSNNSPQQHTEEEINIIENSFEFLIGLITFATSEEDVKQIENFILKTRAEDFKKVYLFGIVNKVNSIRDKFSFNLIKYCKIWESLHRYDLIFFLFVNNFEIFNNSKNINDESKGNFNYTEFYEFFGNLFEIYYNLGKEKIPIDNNIDPRDFILKLAEEMYQELIDTGKSSKATSRLSNEVFIGHLRILTKVVQNVPELKAEISKNNNMIQIIMNRVLFKQNSKEMNEMITKEEFINPDKIEDNKNNRNTNLKCRNACYNFILAMLKDSIENFENFFSLMNVFESDKEPDQSDSTVQTSQSSQSIRNYYSSRSCKREEHVGLRNLGCICYMNSMMQQFFMVPSFRYSLLQINDNQPANKSNALNIDDNVLHQVQRMFTYLDLSSREDYNPRGFCYSFKDFDGNPTNTSIQQDSQEFLNRFFDKLENSLKPTSFKYLMQSIFGGKTCSQLICEDGCGNVKNRFEDFYNLSLEVANMKTLNDSLEKFISPQRIDEYNCDTCQKKVTITKINSLAELPNVLIIHLQRIYYNYEHDRNEKINSRLEFPRILNLKNYTIEELTRKNKSRSGNNNNNAEDSESSENANVYETDEVYFKQDDYYEYHLVGVNIHFGSADAGHYFSYINTTRSGQDNSLHFDPNDKASWLTFNDSFISKFNPSKLEEECFGGSLNSDNNTGWHRMMDNSQSAYMLIYERKVKSPVKVLVQEPSDKTNLISFKEEESLKISKQFDVNRKGKDSNETQIAKGEMSFYDNAKNEFFQYKPFFSFERLIPKEYYLEVSHDNLQFQKHQNILDEQFINFFENVIKVLDVTISNMKEMPPETSDKICVTLLNFIFNILNTKDKQKLLEPAIDKFLHCVTINKNCLKSALDYILSNLKSVQDALYNEEVSIVSANAGLLFDLIKRGYEESAEEFSKCVDKAEANSYSFTVSDKTVKLIQYLIELFPKVPCKYINNIWPVYDLLNNIAHLGDATIRLFSNKDCLARFITYLIGKESPCYKKFYTTYDVGTRSNSSYNKCENLIHLILFLYQRSDVYSILEDDLKCLKASSFLKFCYSDNPKLFSDLLINFSTGNEEFTLLSCEEITKYVDDVTYHGDSDLVKLVTAVLPVLNIEDELQLLRFECILGFPNVIVEEPNHKSKWPIFGYNKLPDESSKWVDYKSVFSTRGSCALLKKITSQRSKESTIVEVFLMFLSNCVENHAMLKYIRNLPSEEPQFEDFISWGVNTVHHFTNKYDNTTYLDQLKRIVEKLNPLLTSVLNDKSLLKGFKSFGNRYLPYEVKREEVSLLMQGENLFIVKIEYFTNVIPFGKNIDWKKSATCYASTQESINSGYNYYKDRTVEESQNIKPDDTTIVYDMADRPNNEREFLKKLLPALSQNKKVVVQNKYAIENVHSTLIRFVVFNTSNLDGTVYVKIKRPAVESNEFIPRMIVSNFNSFYYKNLLTVSKIKPDEDWTTVNDLEFDVQVDWTQFKPMNNYYANNQYNAGSHYTGSYDLLD